MRAVRAVDGAARQRAGQGLLRHPARDARARCSRCSTAGVHPRVPSRGSVGASGDLAPLAHLALVLIGEGEATVGDGARVRAAAREALRGRRARAGHARSRRKGSRSSTARSHRPRSLALALAGAERLARAADIAAALSIDALRGSMHPFDARIHDAAAVRRARQRRPPTSARLLDGQRASTSRTSNCGRVQDAYSLRCARAGARRGARRARASCARSLDDRGQRRHRQPDGLRRRPARSSRAATSTARRWRSPPTCWRSRVAQLATISERRSDRLVNPALSGLPAFLTRDSGLQSG